MEGFAAERQSKTLTFTRQDTAIGRPFSHHGDRAEALGKGPEVMKKRVEGKWREEEQGEGGGKEEQEEKEEEKEAARKGDGRGGRGREGSRGGGGGVLSSSDVKSLRQKRSGAECCSTCAGNPQCHWQPGDGED